MARAHRDSLWILNHYAATPDLPGGTRHFDIARRLAAAGHPVTIFAAGFSYVTFRELKLEEGEPWRVEQIQGVTMVWLRTFGYRRNDWRRYLNMASYMVQVIRAAWSLRALPGVSRPDVVLGSSVHLLAVLAAWVLAWRHRARFLMEVRDIWPQTLVDAGQMSPRHPVIIGLGWLETFLYRRAEHIFFVPPLTAPHLEARGVPAERCSWVPNGADISGAAPPPPDTTGVLLGMYTGSLGRTNGVEVIIRAAEVLRMRGGPPAVFEIVGQGPERAALDEMRRALGLDSVRVCDPVPKSAVPALLARADFLILCEQSLPALSRFGGSPNKFYDYLAAARPIIVSSDFIKEDVEGVGFGLRVPPEDAEALADAVQQLVAMTAEDRAAMGRRGRAHAQANFSMETIVERITRVAFRADAAWTEGSR